MPSLLAIPFKEYDDDFFSRMEQAARYAALSQEEKTLYDREMKEIWDRASELETATNIGREEGRAEGREEGEAKGLAKGREEGRAEGEAIGRAEEKRNTAKILKEFNIDIDTISEKTGLTREEIENL